MKCVVCSAPVADAKFIGIDENGDPQVLCDCCYDTVRIFFEEVKTYGKTQS